MDLLQNLYNRIDIVCSHLSDHEKENILNNIKKCKFGFLDVINKELTYEDLKNKHKFPAFLDSDNGILYAQHLIGEPKYFLVIWKDGILDCVIMEYNLAATGIAKDINKLNKTENKNKN